MNLQRIFIEKIRRLKCIDGYHWEIISNLHSQAILKWRNCPKNLVLFERQDILDEQTQIQFLTTYGQKDRIDIVLVKDSPIGVFSIKNMSTFPEYGSLIGEVKMRGIGLGYKSKMSILYFWFNELEMSEINVRVNTLNTKVIKANLNMGFKIISEDARMITLNLNKNDFFYTA